MQKPHCAQLMCTPLADNAFMSTAPYTEEALTRAEVDALPGATVVEFGTNWCGWCRGAQPLIETAMADHPQLRHIKVEDGQGRPLGRTFRVKLWPTLVSMRDGQEVARVVRPSSVNEIQEALAQQAQT